MPGPPQIIGKVSPLQMFVIMIFEVIVLALNESIGVYEFYAVDMGESSWCFLFGGGLGITLVYILAIIARIAL